MNLERYGGQAEVLVVGEDPLVTEMVGGALAVTGHRVAAEVDPIAALARVVRERPFVIVVDQIVESEEVAGFLEDLAEAELELEVVLLRYDAEGLAPPLPVTLVSGERWFEVLPAVVAELAPRRAAHCA